MYNECELVMLATKKIPLAGEVRMPNAQTTLVCVNLRHSLEREYGRDSA